jgi:HJR/Mrr/RecB family endonuclease
MSRKKIPDWEKSIKILCQPIFFPWDLVYLFRKTLPTNTTITFLGKSLKQLTGAQFEQFLQWFFEHQGYQVTRLKTTHDKGVDLLLQKSGIEIAVQAKRRQKTCGIKCIQEVFSGLTYYQANHALVITTSKFTKPAIDYAKRLGVELWDWDRFCQELRNQQLSFLVK